VGTLKSSIINGVQKVWKCIKLAKVKSRLVLREDMTMS
jgi:hypothetical protein